MTIRRGSRAWMKLREDWRYRLMLGWETGQPFTCRKCSRPIQPGQTWDLGHLYDQAIYGPNVIDLQPEHAACNRSAGNSLARRPGPLPPSREW